MDIDTGKWKSKLPQTIILETRNCQVHTQIQTQGQICCGGQACTGWGAWPETGGEVGQEALNGQLSPWRGGNGFKL